MSATTFSNMSNPDILLSIQAYTYMKLKLTDRLIIIGDAVTITEERETIHIKISRINELVDALVNEYAKRDNT